MSLSAKYPHRIRLRGPWECEPLDGPPPRRVIMPSRWLDAGLADFHGVARFRRNFGYPGNVDDSEHVWLTCDGCTGAMQIQLNGHALAHGGSEFAFDVTALLSPRNRLEVLIQGETEAAGLWGEVALEIRKDAFLTKVNAERTGSSLILTGIVAGVAPKPLELYVLVNGRHVDYRTIEPTPAGQPVRIEVPEVAATDQTVRVELIHISSIWYVVEIPIPHEHSV